MTNKTEKRSCELCRYYREGACLKTGVIKYFKKDGCMTFEKWKPLSNPSEVKSCGNCGNTERYEFCRPCKHDGYFHLWKPIKEKPESKSYVVYVTKEGNNYGNKLVVGFPVENIDIVKKLFQKDETRKAKLIFE